METEIQEEASALRPALLALGLSAAVVQLTLMRELLCVYCGNELVLGVVLGNWLLLTGLGAWGGRAVAGLKVFATVLWAGLLLLALLPLGTLVAIRVLRHLFFLRGSAVDPTQMVLSCLLVLMPYCVLSGMLLSGCCVRMSQATGDARGLGSAYAWDCAGGLVGGVLFSFALAPRADHFTMLLLPAAILAVVAAGHAYRRRRQGFLVAALFLLGNLTALVFMGDLDAWTTAREFRGQQVVFRGYSPYGRLVVTEQAGQRSFVENGVPIFSTGDPFPKKETVHPVMLQRLKARRVLLLGGGMAGTAAEILKYPIEHLDCVELDPLLIQALRATEAPDTADRALNDPRIRMHLTDARRFVRTTAERYDVVIVDLPDPSTAQLNRLHTREFFEDVHRILTEEGVLSVALAHFENRMTPELEALIAVPSHTLKTVFANVLILPGGQRVHFLGSDGPLTADLSARAAAHPERGFYPEFVRLWYTSERLEDLRLAGSAPARLNRDLNPCLYLYYLVQTLSQYRTRYGLFLGVLAVLLLGVVWRARGTYPGILAAGFSASALNVVVLLSFQTVHGVLYRDLGWLTAAFMGGLALGAGWAVRQAAARSHRLYLGVQLGLAGMAALLPLVLTLLKYAGSTWGEGLSIYVYFPGILALLAALVGAALPLAGQADFSAGVQTAPRLLSADYLGAFFGAMLVSTLLIPLLGVVTVCLITAGLNLLAAGVFLIWRRRHGLQS